MVFLTRPDRLQNRLLAAALAVECFWLAGGAGTVFLTDDPRAAYGWLWVNQFAWPLFLVLYLAFLGTLPTPLSRVLGTRPAWLVMGIAVLVVWVLMSLEPSRFIAGLERPGYANWDAVGGDWFPYVAAASFLVFVFGLIVAVSYMVSSPKGSLARTQATLFLLAFGFRDFIYGWQFGVGPLNDLGLAIPAPRQVFGTPPYFWYPTAAIIFQSLVAYGMLKLQLFDVDLKLKWTIKQSTVAAAFVAVFFVVSELAQEVLQPSLGAVAGILAAGALVFAIAPLQRFADRISDAALPSVKDTEGYKLVRKREVYRAALEGAIADGRITEKEREILARLQDQLGITGTQALAIEREVATGAKGVA